MASISTDKRGNRRIFFVGADGKRSAVYLGKLPIKAAQAIATKIEAIVGAQTAKNSVDRETAEWIGNLASKLRNKIAALGLVPKRVEVERATLGPFLDGFIADRSDVKGSTATVYGHTRRNLIDFFGAANTTALSQCW